MPRDQETQRKTPRTAGGANPVQTLQNMLAQQKQTAPVEPLPPPQPPQDSSPSTLQPGPVTSSPPLEDLPPQPTPTEAEPFFTQHAATYATYPDTEQAHMQPVQGLLYQLVNHHRGQSQKFHLVIVPDDSHPRLETFERIEDMITAIQGYLDTHTSLFPLMGDMMRISKGPNRYLQTPFGVLPLFALPKTDELEFATDGFVGDEPPDLAPPVVLDADEEEEEDESFPMQPSTNSMLRAPQATPRYVAEQDTPVLPSTED